MAAKIRGKSIPTFTIQIMTPHLDETSQAAVVSRHIGATPIIVSVGDKEVLTTYPELIHAAEAPVIDTSCTALLMLARSVHQLSSRAKGPFAIMAPICIGRRLG